jgi:hypothetical protein
MPVCPERPEHIRAQHDAVIHGNRCVPLHLHAVKDTTRTFHLSPRGFHLSIFLSDNVIARSSPYRHVGGRFI